MLFKDQIKRCKAKIINKRVHNINRVRILQHKIWIMMLKAMKMTSIKLSKKMLKNKWILLVRREEIVIVTHKILLNLIARINKKANQ